MKKYVLIQTCSIGLFIVISFFAPPVISYSILILLCFRVCIFLRPTKGEKIQKSEICNPQKALLVIDMQEFHRFDCVFAFWHLEDGYCKEQKMLLFVQI